MKAFQFSIVGLFALAIFYTMHLAAELVIPIMFAVFLNYLLSPAIRWSRSRHIPGPLAAAVLIFGITGAVGAGAYSLSGPTARWASRAPEVARRARTTLGTMRRPVAQVQSVAKSLEEATGLGDPKQVKIQVASAPITDRLFGGTAALIEMVVTTVVLTFLLLAPGDVFTDKLVALLRGRRAKEDAIRISRELERQVSRTLLTMTVINVGVGLVTATALWALDVPDPALWGTVAALANFIPYLGPVICAGILSLVALVTFDSLGRVLVPPAVYLSIHFIESYLVTPRLLERWLAINAVVSFVTVLLLWFVVGVPGAIMALPLLAAVRILCQSFDSLKPLGTFLERGNPNAA